MKAEGRRDEMAKITQVALPQIEGKSPAEALAELARHLRACLVKQMELQNEMEDMKDQIAELEQRA